MDEQTERAKLESLDLTDEVIELILEKKRKSYAKKLQDEIPAVDEVPEEEPTFYPPEPVVPEPVMDRSLDLPVRKALRWWRK